MIVEIDYTSADAPEARSTAVSTATSETSDTGASIGFSFQMLALQGCFAGILVEPQRLEPDFSTSCRGVLR
jgi:hypothetical protein